jgi:hypothetical protein
VFLLVPLGVFEIFTSQRIDSDVSGRFIVNGCSFFHRFFCFFFRMAAPAQCFFSISPWSKFLWPILLLRCCKADSPLSSGEPLRGPRCPFQPLEGVKFWAFLCSLCPGSPPLAGIGSSWPRRLPFQAPARSFASLPSRGVERRSHRRSLCSPLPPLLGVTQKGEQR